MMALGHGRQIVIVEIVKDASTVIALFATVFTMNLEIIVWGQLAATVATWIVAAIIATRSTGYRLSLLAADLIPFVFAAAVAAFAIWVVPVPSGNILRPLNLPSLGALCIEGLSGIAVCLLILSILRVPELKEAYEIIVNRLAKKGNR